MTGIPGGGVSRQQPASVDWWVAHDTWCDTAYEMAAKLRDLKTERDKVAANLPAWTKLTRQIRDTKNNLDAHIAGVP